MTAVPPNASNVVLNTSVSFSRKFKLTAFLHTNGLPLSNKLINFYVSYDNINYTYITTVKTNDSGIAEAYYYDPTTNPVIWFRAEFEGDEDYEPSYAIAMWTAPKPAIPIWIPLGFLAFILYVLIRKKRQ